MSDRIVVIHIILAVPGPVAAANPVLGSEELAQVLPRSSAHSAADCRSPASLLSEPLIPSQALKARWQQWLAQRGDPDAFHQYFFDP